MHRFEVDPSLRIPLAEAGLRTAGDLLAQATPADAHNVGAVIDVAVRDTGGRFYLKAYRYPGWRKSKGLLGRGSGWGIAPCVQEFRNLQWLRAHEIPAVRPVAAASMTRRLRLQAHALLTEWQTDTVPLHRPGSVARERLHAGYAALGQVVRRMHDLGFVHRDLHARNVLLATGSERPATLVTLLDCRRGAAPTARHGTDFDLETLRADLPADGWSAFEAAYRA